MANITLPTNGIQGTSSINFGPIAAALVLSTPIVLICSVGGIMIHHKLCNPKRLAIGLTDKSWMTQNSTPAKKNTASRGFTTRCSSEVMKCAQIEEERLEEVMEDMQEKENEQKIEVEDKKKAHKTRKRSRRAAAKAEQKKEVEEAKVVEYTKGLPRSKMLGAAPQKDIHQAITEIFQEQFLGEELYKQDWKVVETKERKKREVVEMKEEVTENKIVVKHKPKTADEAETAKEEEESSEALSHTTGAISNTTKIETPLDLREMAPEGRESYEERLWFPEDEDFRGLFGC